MGTIVLTRPALLAVVPLTLLAAAPTSAYAPTRPRATAAATKSIAADKARFLEMLLARQQRNILQGLEIRQERLHTVLNRIEAAWPPNARQSAGILNYRREVTRQLGLVETQIRNPPPAPIQVTLARQSLQLAASLRRIEAQVARLESRHPATPAERRLILRTEESLKAQEGVIASTIAVNERYQATPLAPASPINAFGLR